MSTCPPLAVDRLIGLADVSPSMVKRMEIEKKLPVQMAAAAIDAELGKISQLLRSLPTPIFSYGSGALCPRPSRKIHRAATIVADRLCGAVASPIIKNAQEKRQLAAIKTWLERGVTASFPLEGLPDSTR